MGYPKAEDLIITIETVVRSTILESYNIGITVNSKRRRAQYRNFEPTWPHYLVVESELSASRALKLERELQALVKAKKKSIFYKKYRDDTRHKPHVPSLGGLAKENQRTYDLYICWCNYGEN